MDFDGCLHCDSPLFLELYIKTLAVFIDGLKVFLFTISCSQRISMGPLTYVVLKTVSSVMANFNVVSNPRFFMMFGTSFRIFDAKNTNEYVIYY